MARPGLAEGELGKIMAEHSGKVKRMGKSNLFVVELPANASEQAVVQRLAHNPHLKFAELDHRDPPGLATNDPYLGSEWHIAKIGAPAAWDTTQGAGVTIAILDSGVDGAHPDLTTRLVPGWNFFDNNSNTSDVYGHGTKTAGAAAAASDNGIGVASVAGQAKIMPLRVTDVGGSGYASMIANGLIYAADRGVRVASISFANMPSRSSVVSAAQYMKDKNGLVFVAAGNSGINENFTPTTSLIPVSATDGNDSLTAWSSFGNYVALSAPGVSIYTTANGGGYEAVSGTSFSSPVTAGVAALAMAAAPSLSSVKIESLLYSSALDLGTTGRDMYYGYGRVSAQGAVQAAQGGATTAPIDTTPPTASISAPIAWATISGLVSVDVSASDNVGVARVVLAVNGASVATDTSAPYGFSWDSRNVANGVVNIVAYVYDAAGNTSASVPVTVTVANVTAPVTTDTTPPIVTFVAPSNGANATNSVTISTTSSDDSGAAGITQSLYIDGELKAQAVGATLNFKWNSRRAASGAHAIQIVARDAAGNAASSSVQVTK
ncbi:MAG: S8 family serine peptidase [Rhodoferax sp.]|nr:S8 family serine peptidase [Rhodoferax sp.]